MNQPPKVSVQKIREYTGHKGSVYAMAIDSVERYLYTAGDDGVVARWDLEDEADVGEGVLRIGATIFSLLVVDKHDLLIAGASDGTLYFVDLNGKGVKHTYCKTEFRVFDLWYDPEYDYLWFMQAKGYLGVISLESFEEVGYQQLAQQNLRCIVPSSVMGEVLIGASDGKIRLLHKQSGTVKQEWIANEPSVFTMGIIPGTHYLLSAGRDAQLRLWEWQGKYIPVQKVAAHMGTINHLALSPDAKYIVTASRDKTIKLWEAATLRLLKVVDAARNDAHKHSVNKIKWLKSDNSVISGSDDKRIIRWHFSIEK
ncbi:MAG: hypothetical protein AAF927_32405 [Bacteroidota bacterium]